MNSSVPFFPFSNLNFQTNKMFMILPSTFHSSTHPCYDYFSTVQSATATRNSLSGLVDVRVLVARTILIFLLLCGVVLRARRALSLPMRAVSGYCWLHAAQLPMRSQDCLIDTKKALPLYANPQGLFTFQQCNNCSTPLSRACQCRPASVPAGGSALLVG